MSEPVSRFGVSAVEAAHELVGRFGAAKLARAGYSLEGLIEFFDELDSFLEDLSWLSTHPASQERVDRLRELSRSAPPATKQWVSEQQWEDLRQLYR